jgi:hypothetical protein
MVPDDGMPRKKSPQLLFGGDGWQRIFERFPFEFNYDVLRVWHEGAFLSSIIIAGRHRGGQSNYQ